MFNKIIDELIDGKKTYSISGFVLFSNIAEKISFPATVPEWTEVFNLCAAIGASILVLVRLISKFMNRKNK